MKKSWLLMLCLALAGCVKEPQNAPKSVVTPPPAQPVVMEPQPQPVVTQTSNNSPVANETCVKELAALRTYNPKSWNRFNAEMRMLTRKTSQYLSIKNDLNPEINELVGNAYDSRMKTLCYRIQTTLGQSMINQANQL